MNTKHTTGNWIEHNTFSEPLVTDLGEGVTGVHLDTDIIREEDHKVIGSIKFLLKSKTTNAWPTVDYLPEMRANAKLISASPELLEACLDVLENMNFHDIPSSTYEKLTKAIEKATV